MSKKQETAQWVEDAAGVWHFLLGGVDGPCVADIARDNSPNAPAGTYVGQWFKRGKVGGLIVGTSLYALKVELVKVYLHAASPAMRARVRDALKAAVDKRRSEYSEASSRHEAWIDTHACLFDFAQLLSARGK